MDPATHIAHLQADAARLLDAYREDPHAAVVTCPPWDRAALLHHVAGAHSWVRAQVEHGPSDRVRFKQSPQAPEGDELPDWYEDNVRGLVDALSTMDTDARLAHLGRRPARVVLPAPHGPRDRGAPLGRRRRRRSTPRWRSTASTSTWAVRSPRAGRAASRSHGTIHLHATDVEGEWLVTLGPDGITFEHGHAKGDVALRGTASDLLLWAWNRVPRRRPLRGVR